MGRGCFARRPQATHLEVLHVGVASELLEPALGGLAAALLDEGLFNLRTNFVDREGTRILAVLGEEEEGAFGRDERFAAFTFLEGKDDIAEFLAQVGATLPAPVAALGLAGILAVLAG